MSVTRFTALSGLALIASGSVATAAPSVANNTITWPDNGWYQVQRADDYSDVCSGTSFCEVDDGVYNVINHSTGERFQGIEVPAQPPRSEVPTVTVDGNVIRWPDNGDWYQVQRASDYSSVCNGTAFCAVEGGLYNVINHSTGERFNGVAVVEETILELPPGDMRTLLNPVGTGSPLSVDNSRAFLPVIFQILNATADRAAYKAFQSIFMETLESANGDGNTRFVTQSVDGSATTFACPQGGTYTLVKLETTGGQRPGEYDSSMNSCKVDGEEFNGDVYSLRISSDSEYRMFVAESRENDLNTYRPFMFTNASGVTTTTSAYYNDSTERDYLQFDDDNGFATKVTLGDASLSFSNSITGNWGSNTSIAQVKPTRFDPNYSSFNGSFAFKGDLTNNIAVEMHTVDPFTNRGAQDLTRDNYTVGLLVIKDENGGQMTITADADRDGFIVRVDAEGQTDQYFESWSDTLNIIKSPKPGQ